MFFVLSKCIFCTNQKILYYQNVYLSVDFLFFLPEFQVVMHVKYSRFKATKMKITGVIFVTGAVSHRLDQLIYFMML